MAADYNLFFLMPVFMARTFCLCFSRNPAETRTQQLCYLCDVPSLSVVQFITLISLYVWFCLSQECLSYILTFLQYLIIQSSSELSLSGLAIVTSILRAMHVKLHYNYRGIIFTSNIEHNLGCIKTLPQDTYVCNHQRRNVERYILLTLVCYNNLPQTRMV